MTKSCAGGAEHAGGGAGKEFASTKGICIPPKCQVLGLLPTRGQPLLPAGLHIWDTFAVQAPPERYLRLTWQRSLSARRAGVAAGKLSQDSLAKLQPSGSTRLLALVPFMRGAFKESF